MFKSLIFISMLLNSLQVIASDYPEALELLNKYGETLDSYQSYIIKSNTLVKIDNSFSGKSKLHPKQISGQYDTNYTYEIRYDGERLKTLRSRWGDLYKQKMGVPESGNHYSSWLWDGKDTYQYAHNCDETGGNLKIVQNKLPWGITKDEAYKSKLSRVYHGGALMGYFYGDDERIDTVLQTAHKIKLQEKMENIGGSDCYVLEADTKRGRYTLWIDPKHGYNIAKAMVQRSVNDRYYKKTVEKGCRVNFLVENVRFEKVDGVWVPFEADTRLDTKFSYGDFGITEKHHKITGIIFNPDHNALGSFLPNDIRNGTIVTIIGFNQFKYTWQDGKLIPNVNKEVIAELDRMAAEIMAEAKNDKAEKVNDVPDGNIPGIKIAQGRNIFIPDANSALKHGRSFILDFDTGKLIYFQAEIDSNEMSEYLLVTDKGDIAWNGSVVAFRDAKISAIKNAIQSPMTHTSGSWCNFYKLPADAKLPYNFGVSVGNKEYVVHIREVKTDGIEITYGKIEVEPPTCSSKPDSNEININQPPKQSEE